MAIFQRGDIFAKCTIVRLLGVGRVAEVYEVVTANGARRALEILKEDAPLTSKLHARLSQECDILAMIEHLNVVRFYDAGVEQGRVWLLIELVEGTELERIRIEAGGVLPIERALRLVRQACEGVAVAHTQNVVHRALSPENILVTSSDLVKVVDFGSAKITKYGLVTTAQTVFVSGWYIAPEVLLTGVAEPSCDVFSLALVLYVLLTGAHPMASSPITTVEASVRQLAFEAPPLATLGRGVPGDLSELVQAALSRDPKERPAVDEMAKEIGAILGRLLAPQRRMARNLPVPQINIAMLPTELAMPAFPEMGRSAVLPPDAPAVSTLRCVPAPALPAKTMPMEAMEAPAERGSTAVPVERAASAAPGKRGGRGLAAAAGVLALGMLGMLAVSAWVLIGRVGGGGDVAGGAGSAVAPTATATPSVPAATATPSALPPATTATATTTAAKPSAPPARRRGAPAKVKPPFP